MAIRHFRHHLLGTTFRLRTDHCPLKFMSTILRTRGDDERGGLLS